MAEIRKKTDNEKVHLLHADLGSQKQIRAVAAEFLALGKPLHVLVNNAGLGNTKRIMTEDGIEMVSTAPANRSGSGFASVGEMRIPATIA